MEVLEIESFLWLTPSELFMMVVLTTEFWLSPLALSEHVWHLERWHLWGLEFWHLWHSSLHFLLFLGSGFLDLGPVISDFLLELFSGDVIEFLFVPWLIETVEHDTGLGDILNNVGDLLDSLLISGAGVVFHGHVEELVSNTDEIKSMFHDSIHNFTVSEHAGIEVIKAPVLPDIADLLHLASFVVLIDSVDEHVSGGLHLVCSNCIIVLVELDSKVIGVLPGWLNPFTEALLGDWIILLVVHSSDGLNV